MQPLNDQERESLVPALELCAELGIETGWDHDESGLWIKADWPCPVPIDDSSRYDYRSLCEAIAEWLAKTPRLFVHRFPNGWRAESIWRIEEGMGELDCTDCKLAALTAAAKGVGKVGVSK